MKRASFIALLLVFTLLVGAQNSKNIVTWSFSMKETATDSIFELHITATIQSGWHLYSQTQPPEAIAIPTSILINPNFFLVYQGKIKEVGKLEHFHDKQLDIKADQYSKTVTFIQRIKVKAKIKTSVTGTIEFQVCNDEKCLPPTEEKFDVKISSL